LTQKRVLKTAVLHGWRKKCPSCGFGKIFNGYIKVIPKCNVCGLELFHHRADDGPAYLTILLVGHILAPLLLLTYEYFNPDPLLVAVSFSIVFLSFALYLLPRLKGVVIGIQWSKRMHGFNNFKNLNK
jgi:uncharacterized protein (DUF983 family)